MAILFHLLVVSMLLLSTSCVQLKPVVDKTRFYALGIQPERVNPNDGSDLLQIYVERPNLPSYVDSVELRYVGDNGEIYTLPNARWSEPVEYGIVRSLNASLQAFDRRFLAYYPWPQPKHAPWHLKLNFHELMAKADGSFDLVVDWKLEQPNQNGEYRAVFYAKHIHWTVGDAASLVAAWDAAIAQLLEVVYQQSKQLTVQPEQALF